MSKIEECLLHCSKLLNLLEEDLVTMEHAFKGEMLDVYRTELKQEIVEVNEAINVLKRVSIEE